MISIHRHPDTKQMIVMLTVGSNANYLQMPPADTDNKLIEQMIGSCAKLCGGNWEQQVEKFNEQYRTIIFLSKERKRRVKNISNITEDLRWFHDHLVSNGILTMSEIHWFDWYTRKHRLL